MTATSSGSKWETAPLSELVRFIVSHYHAQLRTTFVELIALAERVETTNRHHPMCPWGLRAHLEMMHEGVLDHLAKEERVLFPMILEGYGARTAGPVRVMELEHDEHCRNLSRTRELTHNLSLPSDASDAWRDLYLRLISLELELRDHIHLENDVLFPRALVEE